MFGRNWAVTADTVAVRKVDHFIDGHLQMMQARSIGQKGQRELPGFDKNKEFKDWITSHGDVTCGPETGGPRSYRRVTFNDQRETFDDIEGGAVSTSPPTEEVINTEWGVDSDLFPPIHRAQRAHNLAPGSIQDTD